MEQPQTSLIYFTRCVFVEVLRNALQQNGGNKNQKKPPGRRLEKKRILGHSHTMRAF